MVIDDRVGGFRLSQGRALVAGLTAGFASRFSALALLLALCIRFRRTISRWWLAAVAAVQRMATLKRLDTLFKHANRIFQTSVLSGKMCVRFLNTLKGSDFCMAEGSFSSGL